MFIKTSADAHPDLCTALKSTHDRCMNVFLLIFVSNFHNNFNLSSNHFQLEIENEVKLSELFY